MTDEQKKDFERLKALHAARKLTRQQAPLLANLTRMAEQEAFNEAFERRTASKSEGGE